MESKPNGGDFNLQESSGRHHHSPAKHNHHQYFSGVALKITLLFTIMGITSLLLNQSTNPMDLFQKHYSSSSSHNLSAMQQDIFHHYITQNLHSQAKEEEELEKTLRKAVMNDDKTVIITALNSAWSDPNSVFDLFLESFRIGIGTQNLLKHVVVLTLDPIAHSRCLKKNFHCYPLFINRIRASISEEAYFNTEDYRNMLWTRIDFLLILLQRGYDFVFTDADVMWFRDPFPRLYPDGDFQIACDSYLFNNTNLDNTANGGFTYVKSNIRTIQFYKYWYTGKYYFPKDHDQGLFNIIKYNPFVREIGLQIRFLDTDYFGGFCQPSRDLNLVVTMHSNCCINLLNKNIELPVVIRDWKNYMASPTAGTDGAKNLTAKSCPWSIPRTCEYLEKFEKLRNDSSVWFRNLRGFLSIKDCLVLNRGLMELWKWSNVRKTKTLGAIVKLQNTEDQTENGVFLGDKNMFIPSETSLWHHGFI